MIACARRCRKRYYFLAKLSLRPAHKEWENDVRGTWSTKRDF